MTTPLCPDSALRGVLSTENSSLSSVSVPRKKQKSVRADCRYFHLVARILFTLCRMFFLKTSPDIFLKKLTSVQKNEFLNIFFKTCKNFFYQNYLGTVLCHPAK